jgi:predicted RNA-binding Zn-ribbon protein involved in translation (DUF1610 family)
MAVEKMICPACGAEMNYHAEKLDHLVALRNPDLVEPELGGAVSEIHSCPACGNSASRRSSS